MGRINIAGIFEFSGVVAKGLDGHVFLLIIFWVPGGGMPVECINENGS
jgi:hypothetical protein